MGFLCIRVIHLFILDYALLSETVVQQVVTDSGQYANVIPIIMIS